MHTVRLLDPHEMKREMDEVTVMRHTRRVTRCVAAALLLVAVPACDEGPASPSGNVTIMSDFGSKIVYGTSRTLDVDALRAHCRDLRGSFNECGTVCPPGPGPCITVCAYTCEDIRR